MQKPGYTRGRVVVRLREEICHADLCSSTGSAHSHGQAGASAAAALAAAMGGADSVSTSFELCDNEMQCGRGGEGSDPFAVAGGSGG